MLVTIYAKAHASDIFQGNEAQYYSVAMNKMISSIDFNKFDQQRVVIKGCGDKPVPVSAYVEITKHLHGRAQSIMYGEPCSTVPIYKKPREINH